VGCGVWDWGSGFRASGFGFVIYGSGFRVQGLGMLLVGNAAVALAEVARVVALAQMRPEGVVVVQAQLAELAEGVALEGPPSLVSVLLVDPKIFPVCARGV